MRPTQPSCCPREQGRRPSPGPLSSCSHLSCHRVRPAWHRVRAPGPAPSSSFPSAMPWRQWMSLSTLGPSLSLSSGRKAPTDVRPPLLSLHPPPATLVLGWVREESDLASLQGGLAGCGPRGGRAPGDMKAWVFGGSAPLPGSSSFLLHQKLLYHRAPGAEGA